ncbi:MAG: DUF29 domain-containing protein [Siculibacillus sp.]
MNIVPKSGPPAATPPVSTEPAGSAGYDVDLHAWALAQAAAIRAGRFDLVDLENVAEEIESLGRSDRRATRSQIERLLVHLLKWQCQPSRRSRSWAVSIADARHQLDTLLGESPSLVPHVVAEFPALYAHAREMAMRETGLAARRFPVSPPFSLDEARAADFWPGGAPE